MTCWLLLLLVSLLGGAQGFRPWVPTTSLSLRRLSLQPASVQRAATKLNDIAPNNANTTSSAPSSSSGSGGSNKLKEIGVPVLLAAAVLLAVGSQAGSLQTSLTTLVDSSVSKIAGMGNWGYLYFAAIYIAAEVLAIPVFPLTASSGYLFGLIPGTMTVLISATVAACISFTIGRTILRGWASKITNEWPKWKAIDGAIAKEGFKVILLLRLSPLLPFAVSNYLYGITSVDFASFFFATFIGFAPGTLGIVYAGSAGKAFFTDGGSLPWYVFVGAGAAIILAAQTLARVAGDAIKSIEEENNKETPIPPPI